MDNFEKAKNILKENNQQRILKELEKNKNEVFVKQIINLDFEKIQECINKIDKKEEYFDEKIENIKCVDEDNISNDEKNDAINIGQSIISKGKYAVVTMAGGQRYKTWHR